jgi:carbon-monoxide dehydrogenase catalytic subunit
MVAAGTSAHSDHGAHIIEVFERIIAEKEKHFQIKDEGKLASVVESLGLETSSNDTEALVSLITQFAEESFAKPKEIENWFLRTVPNARSTKLKDLNLVPNGIDPTIREAIHRTHMGVDADPTNLILGSVKCALADFLGMDIASNLSDILLGTPSPVFSEANLGVLDAESVNVAVHGHNPLIAESILAAAPEFEKMAKDAGAANGINIVGICCTGNEVLMRHGIPLATNASSQELAIITGAVDAMVADVQCVMPSLANLCECYHTKLITTMSIAKIPGAEHVEFEPETAMASARKILELAIECFKKRDAKKVDIPGMKTETLVGFSPEAVLSVLKKINPDDPLQPLIEKIAAGDIFGIVLFAGCNNYKVPQDSGFVTLAEKLAADNILMLATGCAAGAFAKRGFLSPNATNDICGARLAGVLTDLGKMAGLDRPLPPVWHMGSCVDNSRAARLAFAIANKLGVDVDQLPVVASAPEAMSEKAISIGTWAVALGFTTHLGVAPPVLGGKLVTQVLTETAKDLLGACFIVESDPIFAYQKIKEVLTEKRIRLGLDSA